MRRTDEEFRAEVFRRSEFRIKERKQRRTRILICCLPLALCIVAYAVLVIPAMMPAGMSNEAAPYEEKTAAVEIILNGEPIGYYSDEEKISALRAAVSTLIPPTEATESMIEPTDTDGCVLRFYDEYGGENEYVVSKNGITDTQAQHFYPISEQEYDELYKLIEALFPD